MAVMMTAVEQLRKYAEDLLIGKESDQPVTFNTAEQQLKALMPLEEKAVNIIEFVQASWGPHMTPFPVQRLILKCIYKMPLDNTIRDITTWDRTKERVTGKYTEDEFLRFLYDEKRTNVRPEDVVDPKKPFTTIPMVIGRRGTKTTMCGWIAAYEAYRLLRMKNPQKYFNIAQDQDIGILTVSTGKDHATELFQGMAGMVENSSFFKPYLIAQLMRSVRLTTQYNLETGRTDRVGVSMRAAPCSARGLRGPQRIVVILDEYGHFTVELAKQNRSDKSVWAAVRPSIANISHPDGMPAGKIMPITTPLSRDSHIFELCELSKGGLVGSLFFHMPSVWINDRLNTWELQQEYAADEDKANQEYGAEFTDRVSSAFRGVDLASVARTGPTISVRRNWLTFMGVDIGGLGSGKTDGCSWHVAHNEGDKKVSTYHEYMDPEKEKDKFPLNINTIADRTVEIWKEHQCIFGIYDQWNGYGLQALLRERDLREWSGKLSDPMYGSHMVHFTESLNSQVWKYILDVAEAGQIITYGEDLIKEIYQLQKQVISKDRIRVKAPQLRYYHDDRADAWARALWAMKMYFDQNPGRLMHKGSNLVRNGPAESMQQRMHRFMAKMDNPRRGNPALQAKREMLMAARPIKPRR